MKMHKRSKFISSALVAMTLLAGNGLALADVAQQPLFLVTSAKPRVMLAMSVDHQLFKKAYPDYNDLNGDGVVDITYTDNFDYDGYFDSGRCYEYDSGVFQPEGEASGANGHDCTASDEWSGNFLNWATMTRVDVLRKVLYGGRRSTDTATDTVLERAHLPSDVHAFAKGYVAASGTEMQRFTPFNETEITLCNVTAPPLSGESQRVTDPPQLRVAEGLYLLWASDERNQCLWDGGEDGSNTTKNPPQSENLVSPGNRTGLNVRVAVCVSNKLEANCRSYGTANKPAGILQQYGEGGALKFGMVSGSYGKNHQGGVLRRVLGDLANNADAADNEILSATGVFNAAAPGIISTLNNIRINRWNNTPGGVYNDCSTYGISKSTFLTSTSANRKCSGWGNPVAELYLETLRYLAGEAGPNSDYMFSTGAYGYEENAADLNLPVLRTWSDPIPADEWCAPLNVVLISSSDNSFDTDHLNNVPSELGSIAASVDSIGTQEAISGNIFAGISGDATADADKPDICSSKPFTSLSSIRGICPTAPALEGGYHVAGLAYSAHVNDLRSDRQDDQKVNTFVVGLSKELPELSFKVGSNTATVVPVCGANTNGNASLASSGWTPCTLADVMIRETTLDGDGNLAYVRLLGVWEDSLWGNDYDHDGISQIAVCVGAVCANHDDDGDGFPDSTYGPGHAQTVAAGEVRVTARVVAADAGNALRFGYSIAGTTEDDLYDGVLRKGYNGSVLVDNEPTMIRPSGASSSQWYDPAVKVFTLGASSGKLLPNPLIYAAKYGGFEDADDSGTPNATAEWDADGDGQPDNYFFADNPGLLGAKLAEFFGTINTNSSSASVVANAAVLDANTRIYQAQFNSDGWFGHLYSFPVNVATGDVEAAEWDAASKITAQHPMTGREIITWRPGTGGVPFRWATDDSYLSSTQKALLSDDIVSYLRGADVAGFRSREETVDNVQVRNVLGDIVNSAPALVGNPDFDYPDSLETTSYSSFKAGFALSPRTTMLYVGSNDGMLHAIDATPGTGGAEKFAYVPNAVIQNLPELTSSDYTHRYYADGPPTVVDAYFDTSWHTVLVSGLGGGGKAIYALDVTDPTTFDESNAADLVLWEIDSTTTGFSDLGYTFSRPAVFKEQGSGTWVAAFGNGFSGNGAKLYIVRLSDGALLRTITADGSAGNGMATIAPLDTDGNGLVDLIYAGDLEGNIHRFEAGVGGFIDSTLLYTAVDASGVGQAITTRLEVGAHPWSNTGRMVYFGTGTYYKPTDNEPGTLTNTMYGIWDKDDLTAVTSVSTRNSTVLQQQEVILNLTPFGEELRVLSDNSIDWATQRGWYFDLPSTGERMATEMLLTGGRLIFVTVIPSSSACSAGGDSWLMETNAATGGRLNITVFDIDGDGTFDVDDMADVPTGEGDATTKTPVSGRKFDTIVQSPSIIRAGEGSAGGKEYKYMSSSDGSIERVTESSPSPAGRASWLQLK